MANCIFCGLPAPGGGNHLNFKLCLDAKKAQADELQARVDAALPLAVEVGNDLALRLYASADCHAEQVRRALKGQ
jgi:hypothetical protein